MIDDKATEKLKKPLKDLGLIINASVDKGRRPKSEEKAAKPEKKTSQGKE